MKIFNKIISTNNDGPIILIRLMTGAVFLSEGIQKFLFPAMRGSGRWSVDRVIMKFRSSG